MACHAGLSAYGWKTCHWNPNGHGGWSETSRWVNGSVPAEGDRIYLEGGGECVATDADKDMVELYFTEGIEVAADTVFVIRNNNPMSINSPIESGGEVRKEGGGTLTLVYKKNQTQFRNTRGLTVTEGLVKFANELSSYSAFAYVGPVTVCKDAAVELVPAAAARFNGLNGEGVVRRAEGPAISAGEAYLYLDHGIETRENPARFSGTLEGPVRIDINTDCNQQFLNDTTIAAMYEPVAYKAYGGFTSLPNYIVMRGDSEIEYLGQGGSTERTATHGLWMNNDTRRFLFNAGPYGGTLFDHTIYMTAVGKAYVVDLTGTNAATSVLKGPVNMSGNQSVSFFKKTGTGTWRIQGNHSNNSGVAVEKGTLEYDTIAHKGTACALGTAAVTHDEYTGDFDATHAVPYSIMLGNGADDWTDPYLATLKYVGTGEPSVQGRTVVVKGAGRFASEQPMKWDGITSAAAGRNTVVLGGSASGSIATAVTNGMGTLSVAKDGTGDWTVTGGYDFTGGAYAREGKLTLDATSDYSFFKLTIMENWFKLRETGDGTVAWLTQFALIDADGKNWIEGLKYNEAADGNVAGLNLGEAALGKTGFSYLGGASSKDVKYALTNLFYAAETAFAGSYYVADLNPRPALDRPESWTSIIVRPNEGFKTIRKYDIRHWAANTTSYGQMFSREPRSWKLEGSMDGINWTTLHTVISNDVAKTPKETYCWASNAQKNYSGYALSQTGEDPVVSSYLETVGAGAGAELVVKGGVLAAGGITYNSEHGAGTIAGIEFANSGKLEIVTDGKVSISSLPYVFRDCLNVGNIEKWSVFVNGVKKPRWKVVVMDEGLKIIRPGFAIKYH